jgi:Predicted membrane protein
MTDPQAKHPIDEIFRKSFENLPAQADPSGWDSPSDKVWQNVQHNIRPGNGIGLKAIGILAAVAIAIVVGMVWLSPATKQRPAVPAQTEQGTEPTETNAEQPAEAAPAPSAAPSDSPANLPSYKNAKKALKTSFPNPKKHGKHARSPADQRRSAPPREQGHAAPQQHRREKAKYGQGTGTRQLNNI